MEADEGLVSGWSVYCEGEWQGTIRFLGDQGCSSGFSVLFLLVMDPLLRKLESSGLGLSVNGLFAGAFLHADDIRTMANSSESLEAQIREVTVFTKQNFLVLNPNKCEILCSSKAGNVPPPPTLLH